MLKIWYYGGTDYIKDAPSYFDNVYEDEWIEELSGIQETIIFIEENNDFVFTERFADLVRTSGHQFF